MSNSVIFGLQVNEIILILSLVITIILHFHFVNSTRKREKFNRFDQISQRLLDTGHSIKDFNKKQQKLWDSAVLNDCEYLGFLVRKKEIDFDLVKEFLEDALKDYYENILRKRHSEDFNNPKKYPEFKWLYKVLADFK